jgi:hypothetical protein
MSKCCADERDAETRQGRAVLEQHRERRRILALPYGLIVAAPTLGPPELLERHPPGGALEQERQAEHDIVDDRVLHRFRVAHMDDALIDGHPGPEGKDQKRDDEGPEIELPPVT